MHFICIVCILSCAANGVINDDDQAAAAARDSEPAGLSIDAVRLFVRLSVCRQNAYTKRDFLKN